MQTKKIMLKDEVCSSCFHAPLNIHGYVFSILTDIINGKPDRVKYLRQRKRCNQCKKTYLAKIPNRYENKQYTINFIKWVQSSFDKKILISTIAEQSDLSISTIHSILKTVT